MTAMDMVAKENADYSPKAVVDAGAYPHRDPRHRGHHGRAGDDIGRGEAADRVNDPGSRRIRAWTRTDFAQGVY